MPGLDFALAWMNLYRCILRMFEDTSSLGAPHMFLDEVRKYQQNLSEINRPI